MKRFYLVLSLVANLGLLAFFKYTPFFIETLNLLLTHPIDPDAVYIPIFDLTAGEIFLPVGISFYTFQTMSYSIDVYRGKLSPTGNVMDFAFFVTFFPQLVAGPIVRARDFHAAYDAGRETFSLRMGLG